MKARANAATAKQKRELLQGLLPKEISILGKPFKITVTNLKGSHGDCNEDTYEIRIHQNLEIEQARMTLFHESIHAALAISGHKQMLKEDQEEALVRMLEQTYADCIDIDKLANLDK